MKNVILKFNMPRYLGQHFLINKKKLRKIVDALELRSGDVVLEIGPGHGELTSEIVSKFQSLKVEKFKIIAIEKDKNLAKSLKEKFKGEGNIDPVRDRTSKMSDGRFQRPISNGVEIIEGDALKLLPQLTCDLRLTTNDYKIVGNIPYYITGYLLRILGELENLEGRQVSYGASKPSLIVLLIQKEVAERIVAKPPKMNLLAASVQFWAKPEIIGNVSKKDFRPTPKVDSAIIKLTPITFQLLSQLKCNEDYNKKYEENDYNYRYYKFIKIFFKQPRKTILNNLVSGVKCQVSGIKNKEEIIEKLRKLKVNPFDRPQDLSVEQIIKLSTSTIVIL